MRAICQAEDLGLRFFGEGTVCLSVWGQEIPGAVRFDFLELRARFTRETIAIEFGYRCYSCELVMEAFK